MVISVFEVSHMLFYEELIRSIPEAERQETIRELDSDPIILRAEELKIQLSTAQTVVADVAQSRTLFLAALRCLQKKDISVAQLTSLHILDSALKTLFVSQTEIATSVDKQLYSYTPPSIKAPVSKLARRMQKPLVKRFFNFNESEWIEFCEEMAMTPKSEQFYYILLAPEVTSWSRIVSRIQKMLNCLQVLDVMYEVNGKYAIEDVMVVPSFSMLQAAINAKALRRSPVMLVPTYGYINPEHYRKLKITGKSAFVIYLPAQDESARYKLEFRMPIDGYPSETPFAGAIHDVYHALREQAMAINIARGRLRLALIAQKHPNNKISPIERAIDEILIDGELIYSYSPEEDTVFNAGYRSVRAESFGDLFYCETVVDSLHPDLKRAFIEDMVINRRIWKKEFNLGQSDLRIEDQVIYNEIYKSLLSGTPPAAHDAVTAFKVARTLDQIGLFARDEGPLFVNRMSMGGLMEPLKGG